jgi:serine protease AprX
MASSAANLHLKRICLSQAARWWNFKQFTGEGIKMKGSNPSISFWHKVFTALLTAALLLSGIIPAAGINPGTALASPFIDQKLDPELVAAMQGAPLDLPLEVVIVFSDLSARTQVEALASRFIAMQALPMAGAVLTRAQIEELAGWSEIYSITLNTPLQYFLAESVPLVQADQVWGNYGQTGGNAVVAVIDSGIDASHPDLLLGSKVIQNVKVLPFELALEDQLVTDTSSGHGTHVAGTIGGTGAASGGYYKGVAPDVKLVGLGAGEGIAILTATQAYDWVLQNHAQYRIRVISNSWGSTGGSINVRNPVVLATYLAYQQGMLSVFAAGNDGGYDVMNPYSLAPWLLSVAAGTKSGSLADFSSRGRDGDYFKHPDITAPGVNIYAARSKTLGVTALDPFPNPVDPLWTATYTKMSGTSMATPHVSGAAALLFSSKPSLSPDQVMDLLISTSNPLPGTLLHEAGYGYMDVLAAYETSQGVAGNLASFLTGDRQHTLEEVLGFDPDMTPDYQEFTHTGFVPAGATGMAPIDVPFLVEEGAMYVDVKLTWEPQAEDAFDIEVLDPHGRVVVSSGNSVEEPEMALFVPDMTGEYILRIYPFAAVAAEYLAQIKVAYGEAAGSPPASGEPQYDIYLGVTNVYKTYGALGLASEYYQAGDQGFVVFSLTSGDGVPQPGKASQIVVSYTDQSGNQAASSSTVSDRGGGEYSSSFTFSRPLAAAPGPVVISFALNSQGSLRALPTRIYVNHLETTLTTTANQYRPGDTIAVQGTVMQKNTVTTGDIELSPVRGAQVSLKLVDAQGTTLATAQASTNLSGAYQGSITAPAQSTGAVRLVAEAAYQDSAPLVGTGAWYGKAEKDLRFPGNTAPEVSLLVNRQANESNRHFIHVEARAWDLDGANDVTQLTLTLTDDKGRVLKTWTQADFIRSDDGISWELERGYKVSGSAPWTLTLSATDRAGASAVQSAVITR